MIQWQSKIGTNAKEDSMARILYADDNADLRDSFARFAPRFGHEIVTVDDAARAWELLDKGNQFDLIISDYEMPEMDGLTFLNEVRGDSRTKALRFVLISGRNKTLGGQDLVKLCTDQGAIFFRKQDIIIPDLISALLPL